MTENEGANAEPGLHDAAAGWNSDAGGLSILTPPPGLAPPPGLPSPGVVVRRAGIAALRLAVVPASDDAGGGFQVEVYIDGKEVTSATAGLGMDPYDLLIPAPRLRATPQPRRVPIARCDCGEYGCGSADVTITRDGDRVHWDWSFQVPVRVSFAALQYDLEVARAAGDHSWETAERTAGRLVLTHLDREALLAHNLTVTGAGSHHRDPELFRVALRFAEDCQIFVDTPWQDRSPTELADAVCEVLARGPGKWRATWSGNGPPAIARTSWRQDGRW